MFARNAKPVCETDRLILRLPQHNDFRAWVDLRSESRNFLSPWDPVWSEEHLTRRNFTARVYWAQRAVKNGSGCPLFLLRKTDQALVGAVTLDNIRRGPAQAGTLGYWTGERFARQGYMREAVTGLVAHAFRKSSLRKRAATIRA